MKSILIVEDEQHLAVGIKYNLEAEGYRVTTAGDGPAALTFVEQQGPFDLIVLDLMLPGMSGYAVCERIRATGSDVPILILSARTLTEDRARGFDVGADQYMMKPFDLGEFISRVKGLLTMHERRIENRPSSAQRPRQFKFGSAEINFDTYEVLVAGQSVRLTPLEMKLLEYFVSNEGRVVPRSELLENVWSMAGHANTRAPDQFIRRLRKTFEPDAAEPRYFLTIRDAGYRFVASGNSD